MSTDFSFQALAACAAVCAQLCSCAGSPKPLHVAVGNTLPFDRTEVVEVPLAGTPLEGVSRLSVTDGGGSPVPWQLDHKGQLLIMARVGAGTEAGYTIKALGPGEEMPVADTLVCAMTRPDCQDDLAWENDRCGYRLYGPSFRQGGGTVHGYDIWSKQVDYPLVAKLYHDDHVLGITYHKDHGEGFDGYTVGPTLGAGMDALVVADTLCYPTAYESVEILDNGPLRTTMLIHCWPETIGTDTVRETRLVTLDARSAVNRADVRFEGAGSLPVDGVAAGIAVHADNPGGYTIDHATGIITVDDLTDAPADGNGSIYIGLFGTTPGTADYTPLATPVANAVGQVTVTWPYSDGSQLTYWWGADWTRHGITSAAQWDAIMARARECALNPLTVTIR